MCQMRPPPFKRRRPLRSTEQSLIPNESTIAANVHFFWDTLHKSPPLYVTPSYSYGSRRVRRRQIPCATGHRRYWY